MMPELRYVGVWGTCPACGTGPLWVAIRNGDHPNQLAFLHCRADGCPNPHAVQDLIMPHYESGEVA